MVATVSRYRDAGEFELHEYVVMPDHIHLLLTPSAGSSVSRAMQLIKGCFSHEMSKAGLKLNAIWQPTYHDRRVRDVNEFAQFASYVRENPVRRGLVNAAKDYPYSSASGNFELEEPPEGLKPQSHTKGRFDAGLKARSTKNPSREAGLKARSTKNPSRDAGLKARSTGVTRVCLS